MSNALTQQNRLLKAAKIHGTEHITPLKLYGTDYVSSPFHYILECLIPDTTVPLHTWLTAALSLEIHYQYNQPARLIHGLITQIDTLSTPNRYQLHIKPWIALLELTPNCRIFQNSSIPDIVNTLCKEKSFHDFTYTGLTQTYPKQPYIVQYNETDLHFITRLLQQVGIYYYIEHKAQKHIIHFIDDTRSCPLITPLHCADWRVTHNLSIQRYTHNDYNPDRANWDLTSSSEIPQKNATPHLQHLHYYHYPGHYLDKNTGQTQARIALEAHTAHAHSVHATNDYAPLQAGQRIKRNQDDHDIYFITQCCIEVSDHTYLAEHDTIGQSYHNSFCAAPLTQPFRALQQLKKPMVNGLHTATVVGPSIQELYVNAQGRVKVQFHWDHLNHYDEHSSCWLRVMQLQAGDNFGSCFIPRIGQEVLIGFEHGDIDRPILIGSAYNSLHRPAYALPQEQTFSGFKTRSTPNGDTGNELTFVDKTGAEHIFLKAQKDYTQTVNRNATHIIEGNCATTVLGGDYTLCVQNGSVCISALKALHFKVNASIVTLDPSSITISASSIHITSAA